MTGSVLQFPDSTVESITSRADGSVAVRFNRAFLVKSEGIPYADASTLWTQAGELVVEDAELRGEAPQLPARLTGGSIEFNGYKFLDMVQIPLAAEGYAELTIRFDGQAEALVVSGSGARLLLDDIAKYVKHMDVS